MKLTKEEFRQYILSEVKKMAQEEGWLPENFIQNSTLESVETPITDVVTEDVITSTTNSELQEEVLTIAESANNSVTKLLKEEFEPVAPSAEIVEIKQLNEEFKRWKQLVDFRSPLLIKD